MRPTRAPRAAAGPPSQHAVADRVGPGLALVGLALGAYWSTVDNGFVSDDFFYLHRARTLPIAEQIFGVIFPGTPFLRPLGLGSLVLDHAVFGLRPEGYHLTNLLLHVTNGLLVLAIVRVAFPPLAFLSAGLFLTAPLVVEGVAWISGRFDLVMTTCYLAGVLALLRDRPYVAALGGVGAVLAKESGLTFPLVAIGLSLLRGRGWRPGLPATVAVATCLGWRLALLGGIGGYHDPEGTSYVVNPAHWRTAAAGYLGVPALLAIPISRWVASLFPWGWLIGAVAALPWLGLLRPQSWRHPLLVASAWTVVTYAPTLLFPVDPWLQWSRYLYLPFAGLAFAQAWLLSNLPWFRTTAGATLAAWICLANLNLSQWESASEYSKRIVRGVRETPARDGTLWVVYAGTFGGHTATRFLGPLFRPDARIVRLTPEQARAMPIELRPHVVAMPLLVCLPGLGRLTTCWQYRN